MTESVRHRALQSNSYGNHLRERLRREPRANGLDLVLTFRVPHLARFLRQVGLGFCRGIVSDRIHIPFAPSANLRIRISHNRQLPSLCISVSRGVLHTPRSASMCDDVVSERKRARLLGGRSLSSDINEPRVSAFRCAASSAASISRVFILSHSPEDRNGRTTPSIQTGALRWTHPHVTPSEKRTGVETSPELYSDPFDQAHRRAFTRITNRRPDKGRRPERTS